MKKYLHFTISLIVFVCLASCKESLAEENTLNAKKASSIEILHKFLPETTIVAKDIWEKTFPEALWSPLYLRVGSDVLVYQKEPKVENSLKSWINPGGASGYIKLSPVKLFDYGQFFFRNREVINVSETQYSNLEPESEFNGDLLMKRKYSEKKQGWHFELPDSDLKDIQYIDLGRKIEKKLLYGDTWHQYLNTQYAKIYKQAGNKQEVYYLTYLYFSPNFRINNTRQTDGYPAYFSFFVPGNITLLHPDMMYIDFPGINKVFRLTHEGLPVTNDENLVVLKVSGELVNEKTLQTATIGSNSACKHDGYAQEVYWAYSDDFQMALVKKLNLDPSWLKTNAKLKAYSEYVKCISFLK